MKTRNKVITALILGGGAYYAFAPTPPDRQDRKPVESVAPESRPVALVTKLDVYFYSQTNVKLGVLGKGSCVVAQKPFKDDKSGFRPVTVNTAGGAVDGSVSARFFDEEGAGTVKSCKSEIRQIFADSLKPETKDIPKAQTYLAPKRTPLYFGTATPPSGLYADAGSCVILMSSGHSDTMFHVMVSDAKRMGEGYVSKDAVVPIGNYDWDKGCNAYISGTVINHRPESPVKPQTVQETKPVQTPPATPVSKPLEIRNGNLYIVTADLELRSGPGADFGSLNKIFKDSCVQALGGMDNRNDFVKVLTSYDQKHYQKGFVSRDSLKPTPQGLSKMECFIK